MMLLFSTLLAALLAALLAPAQDKPFKVGAPDKPTVAITAVTPGSPEMKPGETFSATFDLQIQDKYHIYPFGRKSAGLAPVFRFEGAEIAGPIEEPAAKIHKDKVLGDYEILEGKISVRVPLRLPAGTKPGPVTIAGRLVYQICDENLCVDNETPFSFKVAAAGDAPAVQAKPAKPPRASVRIDSIRPEKSDVKVGETVKVAFELSMTPTWHIYPADKEQVTGIPTNFVLEGAERVGRVDQPKGILHKDEEGKEYEFYEDKVVMTVPLRLKPGAKPGAFELKGKVTYQICEREGVCIKGEVPFSIPLNVLEGVVKPAAVEDPEYAQRGFFGLMLLGVLGGLISLVMPCTYPLIPITLTYFVKQAAGSRSHGLVLSTLYSLGIIITFTGVGFILTLVLGPSGARVFAANPWVNIVVGLLFIWFTGSLFGWYEIKLPFGLGQALIGGQRKGAGGAFILGLLFAVVTFTCTIPIAATILSLAAGEHRLAAVMAMLAYSATMALPFFLMGLFPGAIKEVPKSGGWLGAVKTSMAFIELALAIFYLSKADQTWEIGVITRAVVLAGYAGACGIVGFYLLNFLRSRPSAARIGCAAVFFGIGGFFAYGFSGKPLGLMETIVPPPAIHGTSFPAALEEARKQGRPLFIEFTGLT
jgi:thiol:disulfide interchange protein